MRCAVTLRCCGATIVASCREYPECDAFGADREEALARLRAAVLFWLESCPCDQTAGPGLTFDVIEDRTATGS